MKAISVSFRKHILTGCLVLAVAACAVWWALGENTFSAAVRKPSDSPLQIVTSSYITYALAREIGGEMVQLSMLVPPGTELHHFEPTPGSIIAVNEADLFLYVSQQAEPWVSDILKGLGKTTRQVATAPVDPGEDPHVWMTPYGALSMAKRIAAALIKADPKYRRAYQARLQEFERAMTQLHEDMETGLAVCKYRDVVHIGHLAFVPLVDTYGLHLSALTGTTHQAEHSVYKLTGVVRLIRARHIPAVFTEEMVSPDLARTIVRETRVRILPLYAIEEVSKEDFDRAVPYEEYMRRNLKSLQEGLQCQA